MFTKPPVWNKILSSYLWLKYQWLFNVEFWSFIDEQLIRQTMRYFNLQIPKFCTAYGMFVWRSNLTGGCHPLMILNVVLMSYIIGSFCTSLKTFDKSVGYLSPRLLHYKIWAVFSWCILITPGENHRNKYVLVSLVYNPVIGVECSLVITGIYQIHILP